MIAELIDHLRAALLANDTDRTTILLNQLEQFLPAGELADLLERLLAETEPVPGPVRAA